MDNEKDFLDSLAPLSPEKSVLDASKKSKNTKLIVAAVAIFLLIAGAIGAFFILTKSSDSTSVNGDSNLISNKSPESSPTNYGTIIAGYQVYKNDQLGVEFQYPETWTLEILQTVPSAPPLVKITPKNSADSALGAVPNTPNFIAIMVIDPMSIGTVKLSQSNVVQKSLVIDGHAAERVDYKPAAFFNSEVYIPFKDYTYEIVFLANEKSSRIEEFHKVFNKVLETIKFTNMLSIDNKAVASEIKQLQHNFLSGNTDLLNTATSTLEDIIPSYSIVAQVKQLQEGLEQYFNDQQSFPLAPFGSNKKGININILTNQGFGPHVNTGTTTRYLGQIPSEDSFYYSCSDSFYILQFNIPQDTNNTEAGVNFATLDGIGETFKFGGQQGLSKVPDQCLDSDQDGLSGYFEDKYGTDKNNQDTDGDGFLDGEEVRGGFNPNGPGSL